MPRSTRKRKSGGRKRKSMKGGEGLPNVPAGIQGALQKGTEMGSQLAAKAQGMVEEGDARLGDVKGKLAENVSGAAAQVKGMAGTAFSEAEEEAAAAQQDALSKVKKAAAGPVGQLQSLRSEVQDGLSSLSEATKSARATAAAATPSGETTGGRRRKRRQRGGDNGSTTMAEAEEGAKRDGAVKQLVEELKASIRNVEAAERKMNMNGTHGIPEQEHLEEALAALEKMVTAENKLRTEFKKQVRARVSAIHADPMDHAANLLDSGRSQLTTALRRTQNDAKKAVTGVVDQAVEDANNLISGEDGEDGGNSENNRGILGRIASIFGGKKRRRKSKGKKKRKGRKTKRRPKKGQRSKTRKGRLDFVTHKGDKYYNRNGHRQTRNRKGKKGRPYASRKRR